MFTFIFLGVLAVGVVGGLVLHKQGHAAGTATLVTCSVLTVGIVGARLVTGGSGSPSLSKEREVTRYAAALELGRYLADDEPAGTQALCILNPLDAGNQALQDGLQEGLDGRIPVAFAMLDQEAVAAPDAMGVTASIVATLLDQHSGTDLLVSMGDLPTHAEPLAALLRERGVRLAVARVLDPVMLAPYNRAGVFAGAVIYRPDPKDIGEMKNPTPQEVFSAQFKLLPSGDR